MFSVSDSKKVSFPDINYLWIGPPATKAAKLEEGMDVSGPIQMAQKNKDNKIKFWCLKEYAVHYEKEFKDKNIEVCAVEKLLEEKFKNADKAKAVEKFQEIMIEHLKKDRNKIRDRVMVKNALSILLLRLYGGYVMDTNNTPIDSVDSVSLPAHHGFKFPLVEISSRNEKTRSVVEIWRLFALLDDEITKKIFDRFISNWKAFNDMFQEKKRLEIFLVPGEYDKLSHDLMGNMLVEAISYYRNQCDLPWEGVLDNDRVIIDELIKKYNNTHKPKSNSVLPFFFKPKEKKEEDISLNLEVLEALARLEKDYYQAQIVLLKDGRVALFDSTDGKKIKNIYINTKPDDTLVPEFDLSHSVERIVQLSDESIAIAYPNPDHFSQDSCISIYKLDGERVNTLFVPGCHKLLSLPDNMLAIGSISPGSEGISIYDTIGNLHKKFGDDRGNIIDVVLDNERNFIVLFYPREIVKFNSDGVVLEEFNVASQGTLLPLKDNHIAISSRNKIRIYDMKTKELAQTIEHSHGDLYNQSYTVKRLIEENDPKLSAHFRGPTASS